MSNIIESATIDDIALYLQREEGLDMATCPGAGQACHQRFYRYAGERINQRLVL